MKKRKLLLFMLVLIILTIIVAPASAANPTEVTGKIAFAGPPTIVMRPAGRNCIADVDVPWVFYDGNLEGLAAVHLRVISHGPCPAMPYQNKENIKASGTFDGVVNGKSGTFDFKYVGKAWPAEPGELAGTAHIIILSGTGELSDLHGKLDVSYNMGDIYDSYVGKIHP